MVFVFDGSIATSVQPKAEMASEIGAHEVPPLVDFHKPLAGVQAKSVLGSVGCTLMAFTRPLPPLVGVLVGPIKVQLAARVCNSPLFLAIALYMPSLIAVKSPLDSLTRGPTNSDQRINCTMPSISRSYCASGAALPLASRSNSRLNSFIFPALSLRNAALI